MKRKIKRLWKLYQELRRLRKVNTEIVRDCNEANDRLAVAECERLRMEDYARSLEEKLRKRGNRVDFCVPNVSTIVSPYTRVARQTIQRCLWTVRGLSVKTSRSTLMKSSECCMLAAREAGKDCTLSLPRASILCLNL